MKLFLFRTGMPQNLGEKCVLVNIRLLPKNVNNIQTKLVNTLDFERSLEIIKRPILRSFHSILNYTKFKELN